MSAWTVGFSLAVFVSLYAVLGALDFYLMRRFARLGPGGGHMPEAEGEEGGESAPEPAPAY